MRKIIVFLAVLQLLCGLVYAQTSWRIVENSDSEKLYYFEVFDINDRIHTFSSTIAYNELIPHVKTNLMRYDYTGNVIKDSLFGTSEYTFVLSDNRRSTFNNNRFHLIGGHRFPALSQEIGGVLVLDTNFNVLSTYIPEVYNNQNQQVSSVSYDTDSTYVISNYFYDNSIDYSAIKVMKLSYAGDTINYLEIPFTLPNGQYTRSFIEKHEDYFILAATSELSNHPIYSSNLHLFKIDDNFQIVLSKQTTNNKYYFNNGLAVFPNGDFVVGGMYSSGSNSEGPYLQKYVRKFDAEMNLQWEILIGPNSMGGAITKLIITEDGGIAGVGAGGIPFTMHDGFESAYLTGVLFKISNSGTLLFHKDYYALIDEEVNAIENILLSVDELEDGSFAVCGVGKSFWPVFQRGWIMRVGPDGHLDGPGDDLNIVEVDPTGIFLFPNPVDDELHINDPEKIINYKIFDANGALVQEGSNFPINLSKLEGSIYWVELQHKNNKVSRHKIFVK